MSQFPEPDRSEDFDPKDFEQFSLSPELPVFNISVKTTDLQEIDHLRDLLNSYDRPETLRRALSFYVQIASGDVELVALETGNFPAFSLDEAKVINERKLESTVEIKVSVPLYLYQQMNDLKLLGDGAVISRAVRKTRDVIEGKYEVKGINLLGGQVII